MEEKVKGAFLFCRSPGTGRLQDSDERGVLAPHAGRVGKKQVLALYMEKPVLARDRHVSDGRLRVVVLYAALREYIDSGGGSGGKNEVEKVPHERQARGDGFRQMPRQLLLQFPVRDDPL